MTNTRSPDRTNTSAPTDLDFKTGAAIAATMVWLLLLLVVVSTLLTSVLTGRTPQDLGPFAALVLVILTTPFVLIFALPTLIKSYLRRRALLKARQHDSLDA